MNNKYILKKIKSKYIYELIFDYIKNENFKFKLFNYSKYFQNILGLKLFDYKEKFFDNLDINLNDYIYIDSCQFFFKKTLKEKLENKLLKYKLDFDFIQKYLINSLNKKVKALIDQFNNKALIFSDLNIDIVSPFFDFISQSKIFEFFCMRIFIDRYNILAFNEDLISFFNNVDISSKILSLQIFYEEPCNINYLDKNKIKINFEKIKKIKIVQKSETYNQHYLNIRYIINNNYFYKTLFSFDNFGKNLLYLDLKLKSRENIDLNLIEFLNNLKLLEILILSGFLIESLFTIKLYNLIKLKLLYCENITISENCCLNIKEFSFCNCIFSISNILLKFPEVENCKIRDCENLMIDFESFCKIKNLTIDSYNFVNTNTRSLEKVIVYPKNNTDEIEKKMIEKFLLSKTLKDITFTIIKIDPNTFSKIQGINKIVSKMTIIWNNTENDCNLFDFQSKFPNLLEIDIQINSFFKSNKLKRKKKLEIIENSNCKINKFSLFARGKKKIKFFCGPFKNLKDVKFKIDNNTINVKDGFPIFNDKCKIIFKSLISFSMINCYGFDLTSEVLTNIYNNMEKMPNLREFTINTGVDNIDENFYLKFIKKILNLKLEYIYFSPRVNYLGHSEKYKINELKEISNNINEKKYNKIYISKFN